MSAKSNLLFASRFCGRPVGDDFYRKVVDLLGIGHLLDRRPNTLSGGESQRVAIGRALLACKSFLLMDEPLSSLDSGRKEDLLGYIASIPQKLGVPIIYVTHSIEELSFLADHVLVIEAGRSETLMKSGSSSPKDTILPCIRKGSEGSFYSKIPPVAFLCLESNLIIQQ